MTTTFTGRLVSVNTKASGGIRKEPQAEARLVAGHGVEGGIVRPGNEVAIV